MKRNKYRNIKCEYNGISFDSIIEKDRYLFLLDAIEKKTITDLVVHPTFELIPKIIEKRVKHLKTKDKVVERVVQRPIIYTADFAYTKDGVKIVEDVKGSRHIVTKDCCLKIKMMRYFYNIEVKFIYKPTAQI